MSRADEQLGPFIATAYGRKGASNCFTQTLAAYVSGKLTTASELTETEHPGGICCNCNVRRGKYGLSVSDGCGFLR
jgi:hypothetical protein